MRVSAGSALSYATMPGIIPRLKDILFSGFGPVTQLIAIICYIARLLPKNHPSLSKQYGANYGLARVLADAANGIEFKWSNIDKIIIFAMVVCGTIMLWLYLVGSIFFLLTSPSFAAGFAAMVQTPSPTNDVAFMMLDKVFGVPGVFNSSVSMVAPFPTPFQVALQELFRFYSMAIFVVAFVIFLYHTIHLVLDITQTGKVSEHMSDDDGSGNRGFSWLPIRFVVCFGLLLPFGNGLNSAQWITLYTAKYGSGLATNAWINWNLQTGNNPLGENNVNLVAIPPTQDNSALIKSLFVIASCERLHSWNITPNAPFMRTYIVNGAKNKPVFNDTSPPLTGFMDEPTGGSPYNATPSTIAAGDLNDDFIEILSYSNWSDIKIVVGDYDPGEPDKYKQYPGKILPACGAITIPITGRTGEALFAAEGYFFGVMNLLLDVNRSGGTNPTGDRDEFDMALLREYRRTSSEVKTMLDTGEIAPTDYCGDVTLLGPCKDAIQSAYWNRVMDKYFRYAFAAPSYSAYDFIADTDTAYYDPARPERSIDPEQVYIFPTATSFSNVGQPNPLLMNVGILDYGWGGAGLWFNKIGERNGALYSAVSAVPIIDKFPLIMEKIKDQRAKTDTQISGGFCEKFNPRKSGTGAIVLPGEQDQFTVEQATADYSFCEQLFENQALNQDTITRTTSSVSPIEQAIHMFFSEFQIFNNSWNKEVTPMAQLTSVGRILIDKAILGVTISAASYAAGGAAHMTAGDNKEAQAFATGAGVIGDATMMVALMGLTSGFVLYYMLPIMPFIYFFFAVGRWVKVIFEAMVGVPLWALAHMRVGGPGLPGSAAIGGYFLLLEIFIRPILTVFSLVASFGIFSALAIGLNSVFSLVSANLFGSLSPSYMGTGATFLGSTMTPAELKIAAELTRGMIDQFFLSIFYIYLVYTIGMGSFKLIDLIPDNIMRWSGAGVQSFGASDVSDDMIEQWNYDLPQRFNISTKSIGGVTKEVLYNPGERIGKEEKKRLKEEKEKAKAAEASRDRGGDNG